MPSVTASGYHVEIGRDALMNLNAFLRKKKYSSVFILGDENSFQYCLPELLYHCDSLHGSNLLEIESGEQSKQFPIAIDLLKSLTESKADRNSVMLNLGGGVVGDLGGFVASLYMRGIDFIQVPTTLLAMADSSVGGKTGIDFEGLKNQIGTIQQPAGVFIYPSFLNSLPKEQLLSGMAEIIKAGLIADKELFLQLSRIKKIGNNTLEKIIFRSVEIKNAIVKKDPKEKNQRKLLNFGHTVGHAMEMLMQEAGNPLTHGYAVAIGMLVESDISHISGRLPKSDLVKIERSSLRWYVLPQFNDVSIEALIVRMRQDKKNRDGKIHFTLLKRIGSAEVNGIVSEDLMIASLKRICRLN